MPELQRDDITLHYEITGTGPPLLLLAGMLSDSASWTPMIARLSKSFTLIRPDNRTTGRTVPWDADCSFPIMAADALALMDHLGHAKFDVAGHSMGGLLALELAEIAQDRIERLSILASALGRLPRTVAVFDALLAIRRAPEGERLWLRALFPWVFGQAFFANPQNTETALEAALAYPFAQSAEAMAQQIAMFRAYRPAVDLAKLALPVQIILGGQDILVPNEASRAGFAALPDATTHVIDDAGHSVIWDAPEAVASLLKAFHSGEE